MLGKIPLEQKNVFSANDKFKFECHRGLKCFGQCCRDINIFLTPYDVLRLKRKLNMSAREFLDEYTVPFTTEYTGFPVFLLKMREDCNLECPFVTEEGCRVYHARPWSCRMAPVDLRGEGEYCLAFDPLRCHGLNEDREWQVEEWMHDQGLKEYEPVESKFNQIPLKVKLTGREERDRQLVEVFFTTCYNLDRFREFISKRSFAEAFKVPREVIDRIKEDEVELLKFGIDWLTSGIDYKKAYKLMKKVK